MTDISTDPAAELAEALANLMERKVNSDQIGLCCPGLKLPELPHVHDENCPRRAQIEDGSNSCGFPDLLFRESHDERRGWDDIGRRCNITPLQQIASSLDTYGRASPKFGSYRQTFFIMANDVAKAERVINAIANLLANHAAMQARIEALEGALCDADKIAWPEASILLAHPDPERQRKAKAALYAWRGRVAALMPKRIGGK